MTIYIFGVCGEVWWCRSSGIGDLCVGIIGSPLFFMSVDVEECIGF
jgi:hypothetical protein